MEKTDHQKEVVKKLSQLQKRLGRLANLKTIIDLEEEIKWRNGYTTPAEFKLVSSLIDSIMNNVKTIQMDIENLNIGARLVKELN